MEPSVGNYPLQVTFDAPPTVARWRPLVAWLLAIPHFLVLYAIQIAASVCAFLGWFAIVFTGRMPESFAGVIALEVRYQTRVMAYALFLQEAYPPFSFDTTASDPGDYPAWRVDVRPELDDRNRVTTFFRYFLALPHMFLLAVLGVAAFFAMLAAFFAVLATGRWPEGLRSFVIGYLRWTVRASGYMYLLTDEYPPFTTA